MRPWRSGRQAARAGWMISRHSAVPLAIVCSRIFLLGIRLTPPIYNLVIGKQVARSSFVAFCLKDWGPGWRLVAFSSSPLALHPCFKISVINCAQHQGLPTAGLVSVIELRYSHHMTPPKSAYLSNNVLSVFLNTLPPIQPCPFARFVTSPTITLLGG